jgi:hypothetical protein
MRSACGVVTITIAIAIACAAGCGSFGSDSTAVADAGVDGAVGTTDAASDDAAARPDTGDAGPEPKDAAVTPVEAGTVGCLGAAACQRLVFVTSVAYQGWDLIDVIGADLKCRELADAPAALSVLHGRSWAAWLSRTTAGAKTRLVHGTMPYVMTSGAIVANDWADLTKGGIQTAIALDETGVSLQGAVWTGTSSDGSLSSPTCSEWSLGGMSLQGTAGVIGTNAANWTTANQLSCTTPARLYCFEN